jgi:hypothetical protein
MSISAVSTQRPASGTAVKFSTAPTSPSPGPMTLRVAATLAAAVTGSRPTAAMVSVPATKTVR